MTITTIRADIDTALKTTGVDRIYDEEAENAQAPCFVIGNPTGTYNDDFEGGLTYTFPVVFLASRAGGGARAIREIDPYIHPTGTQSVPAALRTVSYLNVVSFTNFGGGYTIGTDDFIGVTWEVQALT